MRTVQWLMLMTIFTLGCGNTKEDDDDDDWGAQAGWRNDTGPSNSLGGGNANGPGGTTPDACTSPPLIDHDEIDSAQPSMADVLITAYVYGDAECDVDITTVHLHYRQETATEWNRVTMTRGQDLHEWRGMIAAYELTAAKIYYYIRAVDEAGQEQIDPEGADDGLLNAYYFGVSTR